MEVKNRLCKMKLKNAIMIMNARERSKRKFEMSLNKKVDASIAQFIKRKEIHSDTKFVMVQSLLSEEDTIALKNKSKEIYLKDAIVKAVYFYLENCDDFDIEEE